MRSIYLHIKGPGVAIGFHLENEDSEWIFYHGTWVDDALSDTAASAQNVAAIDAANSLCATGGFTYRIVRDDLTRTFRILMRFTQLPRYGVVLRTTVQTLAVMPGLSTSYDGPISPSEQPPIIRLTDE